MPNKTFTVGQTIQVAIYGKIQSVTVFAVHPFGTVDVETFTGKCFRLTGLSF
jgi:hypothetical protein